MELKLIEQARLDVLLRDIRASRNRHVLVAGGVTGKLERRPGAVGHERERRAALLRDRLTRMVRQDEHGVVKRRVLAPPGVRIRVVLPGAAPPAEHPPAHDRRADPAQMLFDQLGVTIDLSTFEAVGLAPALERENPFMESVPAFAERVMERLVRSGDEA